MFCIKCGAKLTEDAAFCTNCGAKVTSIIDTVQEPTVAGAEAEVKEQSRTESQTGTNTNTQAPSGSFAYNTDPLTVGPSPDSGMAAVIEALSSKYFQMLCIFMTISVGAAALSSSVDIISILFCVGLWIARTAAVNSNPAGLGTPLKMFKVLNLITVVFNWIGVGFIVLLALLFFLLGAFMPPLEELIAETDIQQLYEGFAEGYYMSTGWEISFADFRNAFEMFFDFLTAGGLIILGVLTLIFAIILALFNIFCYHPIYRCSKSFFNAYETGEKCFTDVNATANWLLVLGILSIVGAIGGLATLSIMAVAVSVMSAASSIVASQILKNYFAK
ncbi:MAG: zinc ribbon domain-containing protein [Ruminococcaceae bacterium]|nr:zinc ribbon domain-containing protein [Oscillospiraceae bacterium]